VREVSGKAIRAVIEVLEEARLPVEPVLAGLPLSRAALGARVDWDVFVAFLDAVVAHHGEALSLEEIGARSLRVPAFHFLRLAGRLVLSPRQLYTVAQRMVGPAMFSNVTVTTSWLPGGRMVVTGELAAGYRESTHFFRMCHGNVVALPRLLDLPPATIEEQAVSGRRGRLVLELPASHTLGARLRRGMRTVFAVGDLFRSVTRQQAELEGSLAALRTSRHELRQLIERLPEGVLVHRGGIVAWANTAVLESLGYDRLEQVVGRHILDFTPPEDRAALAAAMANAPENEVNDNRIEYRVLRPDGAIRRLQAGTVQHVDFEGERARLVVLRDVTEQHRLHEELALAERMTLLGRLAAGLAHEINNPLAYAHASLEVATSQLAGLAGPTDALEQSLARAREGTERVRGIVRDLKMLSRAEDEPGEAVDLHALLDSTLALAANAIGAKARVVRDYREAPRARATRGRLGQLFLNLLLNAADAIPDEGNHEIRVSISTSATGHAVVEISDTGIGIPPALAARVFEPFFTTKAVGSGTGLGLAICHRIVTQLGGEIALESTPRVGTTFRVTLPACAGEPAPIGVPVHPHVRARVLVVDDEPALLRAIDGLIGEAHDVVTVSSGRQALELLQVDRAFDVILADLMMAGVTGVDLFEAVSSDHPGLARRFVFMTGGAYTARGRALLGSVPNRCIEKPFDGDELLRAVGELVETTALIG
jgi:PAS domain S-box-containing protein